VIILLPVTQVKSEKPPNREYNTSYLKFSFVVQLEKEYNENHIPLHLVCKQALLHQSMKPSLLKHHQ